MSQWTHVAGCIRIDSLGGGDITKIYELVDKFGRTCQFDDTPEIWERCNVPCGSEGSLQYKISRTGEKDSLDWGLVVIWGDLRDFDDADEILQWLEKACAGKMIRGCAVKIDVEYSQSYLIHDENDKLFMRKI